MSKRRPTIAVFAGFALLPASFAGSGCGTSSRMSEEAFSAYARSYAPDANRFIGNAVEVASPRMARPDAQTVQLSSEGEARQVRARLTPADQWHDVRVVYVNAEGPTPALTPAQVREAFERGVAAKNGELKRLDDRHELRLNDVDLGNGVHAPLAQMTIRFGTNASTRAAVAMSGPLGTGAGVTTIRISGD